MPWQVEVSGQPAIVTLKFTGVISPRELKQAHDAVGAAFAENGTLLCLADCTQMSGGPSVVDLFEKAARIASDPSARLVKEAILSSDSPEAARIVDFYQTAAINRGINVAVFTDREKAVAWLTGKQAHKTGAEHSLAL